MHDGIEYVCGENMCVYGYLCFAGTCHIVCVCLCVSVSGSASLIRSRVCSVPQGLTA